MRLSINWTAAFVVCMVSLLAVPAAPAGALQVSEITVSDANGQFALWRDVHHRLDDNYTNGAQIMIALDGAPLWGRVAGVHAATCGSPADSIAARPCTSSEFRFGQDIYTPHSGLARSEPVPGERPFAGWLYLSETGRVATAVRSDEGTVEVGVTGPPSLAEAVQTAWHGLIAYPPPLGWSHQIPFEPGILLAYQHDQEVWSGRLSGVPVVSVVPHIGLLAGNILTGANAGADVRVGYGVRTPWDESAHGQHPHRLSIYAIAGGREDWVAYNAFLDRGTQNPVLHVSRIPWVTQYQLGAGARVSHLVAEARGVVRTREYTTGGSTEPYGVITVGWRRVP